MPHLARAIVWPLVWLTAGVVLAHDGRPAPEDRPAPARPLRPLTQKDLDCREAQKFYGLGVLHERHDRLLEAVRSFERARRLDPEAAAVHKALVRLYLALRRDPEALVACEKVVSLDPGDFETWYVYGRELKEQNRPKEAIAALTRGLACPRMKEFPDLILEMSFQLAGLHEEVKDYQAAEAAYRKVAAVLDKPDAVLKSGPFSRRQLHAEAARTQERIGQVCLNARRYEQAIEAFRKAQAILSEEGEGKESAQAVQLNRNLAEVCLAQKRPEEALKYLDKYVQLQPAGADAYELRIRILKDVGREAEVLPSLKKFAARDEHNVALQLLLARELGRQGQAKDAEALYLKLSTSEQPSVDIYRGLFNLYAKEMQSPDKILEMLDRTVAAASSKKGESSGAALRGRAMLAVLRGDPELVKTLLTVAERHLRARRGSQKQDEWQVPTLNLLAVLAARTRQLDLAENLYRRCLANISRYPDAEAEIYVSLLIVLAQARKHEAVIEVCQQGLREAKGTRQALFHRQMAEAQFQLGRTDEALREAERALALSGDTERLAARHLLVQLWSESGQAKKAIGECQKWLKEYSLPDQVRNVRLMLSNAYSSAREFANGAEQLRLILELDPNDHLACNNLGYLLADQGKELEEAEKLIRKAIELDRENRKKKPRADDESDNAAYLDSLGWVLFRRGQLKEAREWLEKAAALPLGADDPTVWDHLGDVCMRLNDPPGARAAWEKSRALYAAERRRRSDERYKDVQHKLELLDKEKRK